MEHLDLITGVIIPYVNFAIFFGLAIFFFKKPLANMAAKRRSDFEALMKEATKAKQLAEEQSRLLREQVSKLDQEVSAIKRRAEEEAKKEAERIIEGAQTLARQLREEAVRIADAETARARADLQNEILTNVKEAVLKKITSDLGQNNHGEYVGKQLNALKAVHLEV